MLETPIAPCKTLAMDDDPLDWPIEERPVIYVAGYYSANPTHGTREAVQAYDALREVGWVPLVPHVSLLLDILSPMPPSYWYAYDLALMRRCDAVYVCPGALTEASTGVQREVLDAVKHDIPVYYEVIPASERYER